MGNVGSNSSGRRRHRSHPTPANPSPPPTPQPQPHPHPQPATTGNGYVFAAATPYPSQYPNPNPPPFFNYPPPPAPTQYPHQFRGQAHGNWPGVFHYHHPCGGVPPHGAPFVDHQKAVTIRNDVNARKETLRVEPDEENPGKFLVAFTFDATAPGR